MKAIFCGLMCVLAGVVSARPAVTVDSVSQRSNNKVTVAYTLANGPAIVTMDVLTNGVSVGRENFAGALSGDVNRIVSGPSGTIVWQARSSWPEQAEKSVTVKLTAWATNAPPDYVVIDCATGATAFYRTLDELSPAFGDMVYKTEKMVLRKIPAAGVEATLGNVTNNFDSVVNSQINSPAYRAVLTRDYYIGVYPVTQGQWERTMTGRCETYAGYATTPRPSWFTNEQYYASRPVENIPLRAIYGENTDMEAYPQFERILRPGRYLYVMRQLTGLRCDLPTDAQWEFACRAGTETSFYSGRNVCREVASQSLGAICNRTAPAVDSADPALNLRNVTPAEGGTYTVGTCTPNAFGLYDLYGNVKEMVADWWCPTWPMHCHNQGLAVDPKGFADDWMTLYLAHVVSAAPTLRGGGFTDSGDQNTSCNSYRRDSGGDMYTGMSPVYGFRLIIQL